MSKSDTKVILSRLAEQDLNEIIDFFCLENEKYAFTLLEEFEEVFKSMSEYPLIGKISDDNELAFMNYRVMVHRDYLIFYKFINNEVTIYRIISGARNYLPDLL